MQIWAKSSSSCAVKWGKSAAPRPDSTLQADLIDFSLNLPPTKEGNRYLAVLSDVFTRELRAVPKSSCSSADRQSADAAVLGVVRASGDGACGNEGACGDGVCGGVCVGGDGTQPSMP